MLAGSVPEAQRRLCGIRQRCGAEDGAIKAKGEVVVLDLNHSRGEEQCERGQAARVEGGLNDWVVHGVVLPRRGRASVSAIQAVNGGGKSADPSKPRVTHWNCGWSVGRATCLSATWPALSRGSHGWEYMYWRVGWGDAEQTPNTPPPPGTSRPGAPDQCYHATTAGPWRSSTSATTSQAPVSRARRTRAGPWRLLPPEPPPTRRWPN